MNKKAQTGSMLFTLIMVVALVVVGYFIIRNIIESKDEALQIKNKLYGEDWDGDGMKFNDLCPCGFDGTMHRVMDPKTGTITGKCKSDYLTQDKCPAEFLWQVNSDTQKSGCYYTEKQCIDYYKRVNAPPAD